jgi:hypothetical protein
LTEYEKKCKQNVISPEKGKYLTLKKPSIIEKTQLIGEGGRIPDPSALLNSIF